MYNALLLSAGGGIISQSSVSKQIGSACVMIGIGGTGLAALRRVKKEVYQHLEPDDPEAAIPKYSRIAFLGIDTDTDDLEVQNPDVTELQADEQWSVNVPALSAMLASPETRNDPCFGWLSPGIKMQGDKGAGGVRQAGRFCLFKRAGSLRSKLSELVAQVMAASGKPSVQIHIFAGISGGTGSGCFLDVCYILRDVLSSINSTVCGYFFLPDTQLYRPGIQGNTAVENYNKRNGYAALRDLDYCMSIPSSGDCFKEDYALGFHVESKKAPVDLCHLISATDTNGVIKRDGFSYSLSVVAEYVLTYLSDVNATEAQKAADDRGLTIEGFSINVSQALGTIRPHVGAERNYNIVGASSAELPLTHIGTYLAAVTYQKMTPSLGRHSSKLACDNFAKKLGCTTNGLVGELAAGVSTAIAFNPDPEKLSGLNEDMQNWSKVPESLHGPIEACRTTAIGRIQANFAAQSKELDSYDANRNAQVEHPTFILRLFNALVQLCTNPEEGPTMAADLLHGDGIHDLRAVLSGIATDIAAKEQNFRANEQLRIQDIINAAHKYNKAVVGWKGKLEAYQDAWTEYVKLQINLELCAKLKNLLPILERNLDTLYRNYFEPLKRMVAELGDTFDANLSWLNSPEHAANESFCWRIFEYDDVRDELDGTVLRHQDMAIEHQNFVNYLLSNFREWNTRNSYRTAQCVNRYMVERFHATLTRTVDNFLMTAYELTDENQLPARIQAELLNSVSQKASPLFWKSPTFQLDDTTTVSNNVLSIPMGSTAIDNASTAFSATTSNVVVRRSALGDRVSCLRFVSGIPLYAYQGLEELSGPYTSSTDKGLHLHERDENWKELLPSPIPYSIAAMNYSATENDTKKARLYDRAVQERVICPKSAAYPDDYVVRILPNTESLVNAYQKETYFFEGQLNLGDLERDITKLKLEREALLPVTVPEEESLALLNDGYKNADPRLDATETVRRDYFVRFGAIQKAAEQSLAELKRIDDKLAEMESWKEVVAEQKQKIERYLMLAEMGYLVRESPVKVQLHFTYKGVFLKPQMCDVNSPYRFASEYQVFRKLDEMDPQQRSALDAELAKKHLNPQGAWRATLEQMISAFTEEFLEKLQVKFQNDVNRDAIPAFYRSLRDAAQEELEILPLPESVPERRAEPDTTVKPVPAAEPSGWKCACGAVNSAEDQFCGECGEPKPAPVSEPEFWFCSNGHKVPWARKFCGQCGPKGGKRPEPAREWRCPSCGTLNAAEDRWCGECGEPKP